jgi:hypothetical protein
VLQGVDGCPCSPKRALGFPVPISQASFQVDQGKMFVGLRPVLFGPRTLRACDFFAFAQKRLLSLERGVVDGKGVLAAQQLPYPLATVLSLSTTLSFLSSRAYLDFLLRSSHRCHLCGSPQENHMQLFEAATLDRKSGEAEGSAVCHSGAPNLPFYNHFPFVILRRSRATRPVP